MRFLIDAQLPPALSRRLTELGHEAEHVADRQLAAASDTQIWNFAIQTHAVIVTKDEDFAQRKALAAGGPHVVWVRLPNARRKELLGWSDAALPDLLSALERGDSLVELI